MFGELDVGLHIPITELSRHFPRPKRLTQFKLFFLDLDNRNPQAKRLPVPLYIFTSVCISSQGKRKHVRLIKSGPTCFSCRDLSANQLTTLQANTFSNLPSLSTL